ncbi:MAG: hypothetical protein ACOYOU_01130 [Kiritimatiellia bacterium]
MRTTLDIDAPVLADLKRLGQARHIPMGRLVSEMLGRTLRETTRHQSAPAKLVWIAKPMTAKVDLADREALYEAMDGKGDRL